MNYEGLGNPPFPLIATILGIIERDEIGLRKLMHYIDPKTVYSWRATQKGKFRVPDSCNSKCPKCSQITALKIDTEEYSAQTLTFNCRGHSTCCNTPVFIWVVEPNVEGTCKEIWTLPMPKGNWELSIAEDKLPFKLYDAYKEAVEVYNLGRWRAVVTECGRALEGITHDQFPEETERQILKQLGEGEFPDKLPSRLFEPIIELTKAIRLGRRTGAHFDLTCPADEEIAREVLELTEYCLRYFYVLEDQSEKLANKIHEMTEEEKQEQQAN